MTASPSPTAERPLAVAREHPPSTRPGCRGAPRPPGRPRRCAPRARRRPRRRAAEGAHTSGRRGARGARPSLQPERGTGEARALERRRRPRGGDVADERLEEIGLELRLRHRGTRAPRGAPLRPGSAARRAAWVRPLGRYAAGESNPAIALRLDERRRAGAASASAASSAASSVAPGTTRATAHPARRAPRAAACRAPAPPRRPGLAGRDRRPRSAARTRLRARRRRSTSPSSREAPP